MLLRWQHLTVGRPEIGVAQALLIPLGDALPQHAASGFASVADGIRDDLARPPALGQPDPALVPATLNKRPHLVEFKNVRLVGLCQCLLQGVFSSRSVFFKGGRFAAFFSQAMTVLGDTPKMRFMARKEPRSW